MKLARCITALFACALCGYSQPTGNVLSRVYRISFKGESGTAFVLDYEDRQYFVTARHIMETVGDGSTASVDLQSINEAMKSRSVTVLLGKDKCVDVAILVPKENKVISVEPIPYPYSFAFGQEAYFLGFPYGLFTVAGQGAVALIKHAYISARVSCTAVYKDGDKDQEFILLDGFNNPGFSGGPVVAPDMFSPFTNIRMQKVIGVIAGYRAENTPLNVDGKALANASIATNTGIIFATPIEKAVELIKTYVEKQKKP
jgi:S1-C subfamily serine protease